MKNDFGEGAWGREGADGMPNRLAKLAAGDFIEGRVVQDRGFVVHGSLRCCGPLGSAVFGGSCKRTGPPRVIGRAQA